MSKIKVVSRKGLFTQVLGTTIPVWTEMHTADSISEAADWLADEFRLFSEGLEHQDIIFIEVPE